MFRDQTTADLFGYCKVPVRRGIHDVLGANPAAVVDPSGANHEGSEFTGYLRARSLANRIADRRRCEMRDQGDGQTHSAAHPEADELADEDQRGDVDGEGSDPDHVSAFQDGDRPMTLDEAVDIVLAGMGLRGGLGGFTSAHADGRGGVAGSDGHVSPDDR